MHLPDLLERALRDDAGQDTVEYALLAMIFGVAGALVFPVLRDAVAAAFVGSTEAAYEIWVPSDPGATP
jgi:Flp pilus assembly pilin Flp